MAITLVSKRLHEANVRSGQEGYKETWGLFAFSTTDANGTIVTGLKNVTLVELTPAAAPNTDEQLYVSTTAADPLPGTVTVARTGTKTSGLKFWAKFRGF